jgi:hypothetical protein
MKLILDLDDAKKEVERIKKDLGEVDQICELEKWLKIWRQSMSEETIKFVENEISFLDEFVNAVVY